LLKVSGLPLVSKRTFDFTRGLCPASTRAQFDRSWEHEQVHAITRVRYG